MICLLHCLILRVRLDVFFAGFQTRETLIAEFTRVGQHRLVLVFEMLRQTLLVGIALVAVPAFECVLGRVVAQVILARERLVANGAHVGFEARVEARVAL